MESTECKTIKLRAAITRQTLSARHPKGSAIRKTLARLSDEELVAMDDRDMEIKKSWIAEKNEKDGLWPPTNASHRLLSSLKRNKMLA